MLLYLIYQLTYSSGKNNFQTKKKDISVSRQPQRENYICKVQKMSNFFLLSIVQFIFLFLFIVLIVLHVLSLSVV